MSERSLAKLREQSRGQAVEVEPENAAAVRAFVALGSQWRTVARSNGRIELLVRTGLDYAALPAVATALRLELDETMLDALRALESETIAINARRNAKLFGRA